MQAGTAKLLELIGDFDRHEGGKRNGYRSTATWLASRPGWDARTAREHVRVARALIHLPMVRAAFESGELSFSKVRALSRVTDAENEDAMLDLAHGLTAAELERRLRTAPRKSHRPAPPPSDQEAALAPPLVETADAPAPTEVRRAVYKRSDKVRNYVRARAAGICEGCGKPAAFQDRSGRPYLEPHHTQQISDGGQDDPRSVIAICPTCHARVHYGEDGDKYNAQLIARLAVIEPNRAGAPKAEASHTFSPIRSAERTVDQRRGESQRPPVFHG